MIAFSKFFYFFLLYIFFYFFSLGLQGQVQASALGNPVAFCMSLGPALLSEYASTLRLGCAAERCLDRMREQSGIGLVPYSSSIIRVINLTNKQTNSISPPSHPRSSPSYTNTPHKSHHWIITLSHHPSPQSNSPFAKPGPIRPSNSSDRKRPVITQLPFTSPPPARLLSSFWWQRPR